MRQLIIIVISTLICKSLFAEYNLTFSDNEFSYILTLDTVPVGDIAPFQTFVKSITITRLSEKKIIQTIYPKDNYVSIGFPADQLFLIEDVNFDNKNDIRLLQFLPASPNLSYYFWTYNSKTQKFQQDTSLENIISPSFDSKTKTIYSEWRDSYYRRGGDNYKYKNGKPVLTKQTEIITDPQTNKQTLIERVLIKGKLTEIKRTTE